MNQLGFIVWSSCWIKLLFVNRDPMELPIYLVCWSLTLSHFPLTFGNSPPGLLNLDNLHTYPTLNLKQKWCLVGYQEHDLDLLINPMGSVLWFKHLTAKSFDEIPSIPTIHVYHG